MANNENVNKVIFGSNTIIDLTGDDVTVDDVKSGVIFHLPSGQQSVGIAEDLSIYVKNDSLVIPESRASISGENITLLPVTNENIVLA